MKNERTAKKNAKPKQRGRSIGSGSHCEPGIGIPSIQKFYGGAKRLLYLLSGLETRYFVSLIVDQWQFDRKVNNKLLDQGLNQMRVTYKTKGGYLCYRNITLKPAPEG